MKNICRKIFVFSVFLYMGSTMYTRIKNVGFDDPAWSLLYSLPLDAFPLKYIDGTRNISTQIGVLSTAEVMQLLEANLKDFPNMQEGLDIEHIDSLKSNQDYLVLRFQNNSRTAWGDLKVYFSFFPYATVLEIFAPYSEEKYYNAIIPYPQFLEGESRSSPQVFTRWEKTWGSG